MTRPFPVFEPRTRRPPNPAIERILAKVQMAAAHSIHVSIKSRARTMLAEPWQMDVIEPDLSSMQAYEMAEHVAELLKAARAERKRSSSGIWGATDLMNLMGAALAARMIRRMEWRDSHDIAKAA